MLLDRGATVPIPHDLKCSCEECVRASKDDSLRFSLARSGKTGGEHSFQSKIPNKRITSYSHTNHG